jgi:2-C-methyl-D-erythritol 4-phosphate cytidylyltransferase/2-C-methyl-D-erythritol 2,4-cyclodiphosphate synthase
VEIHGRSLVGLAVATIDACAGIDGFVVVAPEGDERSVARDAVSPKLLAVVTGGERRQDSVRAGLEALASEFAVVVCHDVARPFATPELFASVLAALDGSEGAIPVVPASDTLKRVRDGAVEATVPRDEISIAQTPQAFRRAALQEGHRRALEDGAEGTDDAALLERIGLRVAAVPGDPGNFKITDPVDLLHARALAGTSHG